ncbi:hypothetical protein [Sinosporangium album]|nr:hypothetical protein [Sinosporangium album]
MSLGAAAEESEQRRGDESAPEPAEPGFGPVETISGPSSNSKVSSPKVGASGDGPPKVGAARANASGSPEEPGRPGGLGDVGRVGRVGRSRQSGETTAPSGKGGAPRAPESWHGDDLSDLDDDEPRTRPAIRFGRVAAVATAGVLVMLLLGDLIFARSAPPVGTANISAPKTIILEPQDDPVQLQAPPPPPQGADVAPPAPSPAVQLPTGAIPAPAVPHARAPQAGVPQAGVPTRAGGPTAAPSTRARANAKPTATKTRTPNRVSPTTRSRGVNPPPPPGDNAPRPKRTPVGPTTAATSSKPAPPPQPPPPPPELAASSYSLHIADRSSGTVQLTARTGNITWSASAPSSQTVGYSPHAGTIAQGSSTTLTLTAPTSGHPPGSCGKAFSNSVRITWGGDNKGTTKNDSFSITLAYFLQC